jgi:hypothetical protein
MTMAPKPKVFWPLTITTANQKLYFRQSSTDYNGSIAVGVYYSAALFATAVTTALNAVVGKSGTFATAVSDAGVVTISNSTTATILRWGFNTTATASGLLGWTNTDTSSALSHVAPHVMSNGWWAPLAVRSDSKNYYESPDSVVTLAVGGQNKALDETELVRRDVEFAYLTEERALTEVSSGYDVRKAIENWWRYGRGRFRYWADASVDGTSEDYFLDQESVADGFGIRRMFIRKAIYETSTIRMRKFQA